MTQDLGFIVAIAAIAASLIPLAWLGGLGQDQRNRKFHGRQTNDAYLDEQIAALRESLLEIVERLAQLEQKLAELQARQEKLEAHSPTEHAYQIATRLVRQGADINELVSVCGITRGEAELILTLHEMHSSTAVGT